MKNNKMKYMFIGIKRLIWEIRRNEIMNKKWIKAASIRAIKTVSQTAIATIGTSVAMGNVDWLMVGSASLLAGILSILTSVAGLPEVE